VSQVVTSEFLEVITRNLEWKWRLICAYIRLLKKALYQFVIDCVTPAASTGATHDSSREVNSIIWAMGELLLKSYHLLATINIKTLASLFKQSHTNLLSKFSNGEYVSNF